MFQDKTVSLLHFGDFKAQATPTPKIAFWDLNALQEMGVIFNKVVDTKREPVFPSKIISYLNFHRLITLK